MAKAAAAVRQHSSSRRDSPLADRLNSRVLQTIRDLAISKVSEDSLDDDYAEIFKIPPEKKPG